MAALYPILYTLPETQTFRLEMPIFRTLGMWFPLPKHTTDRLGGGGVILGKELDTCRASGKLASRANRLGVDLLSSYQWNRLDEINPWRFDNKLDETHASDLNQSGRIMQAHTKWILQACEKNLILPEVFEKLAQEVAEAASKVKEAERECEKTQYHISCLDQIYSILKIKIYNLCEEKKNLESELDRVIAGISEILVEHRLLIGPHRPEMWERTDMADATRRSILSQQEYDLIGRYEMLCKERRHLEGSLSSYTAPESTLTRLSSRMEKVYEDLEKVRDRERLQRSLLLAAQNNHSVLYKTYIQLYNSDKMSRNLIPFGKTTLMYHRD